MLARWPQADHAFIDSEAEADMTLLIEMVRGIRTVRLEYNVDPGRRITAIVVPGTHKAILDRYRYVFARLCNVAEIELLPAGASAPTESASVVVSDVTVYLPLAGLVDTAAECERLSKEQEKLQQQIEKTRGMLTNESFVSRAPAAVVERERGRLAELEATAGQIAERLAELCPPG